MALSPLAEPQVTLTSLVPEGEWDLATFLHAEYIVQHTGGSFRGYWLLMRAPSSGEWKVDEAVFPLEAPKALALLQPKKSERGSRYLDFKSP